MCMQVCGILTKHKNQLSVSFVLGLGVQSLNHIPIVNISSLPTYSFHLFCYSHSLIGFLPGYQLAKRNGTSFPLRSLQQQCLRLLLFCEDAYIANKVSFPLSYSCNQHSVKYSPVQKLSLTFGIIYSWGKLSFFSVFSASYSGYLWQGLMKNILKWGLEENHGRK